MDLENYKTWSDFPFEEPCLERSRSFFNLMRTRRTIRDFSSEKVDREIIKNAIRVAGSAPSGANCQPWYYVVVETAEVKKELRKQAEAVETKFYSSSRLKKWVKDLAHLGTTNEKPYLEEAPYLILVFYKTPTRVDGEREPIYYPVESTGISVGLLLSALHNSGLATLTHTPRPNQFLNDIAGLGSNYKPFLIVVTGKPKLPIMVPDIDRKKDSEIMEFL